MERDMEQELEKDKKMLRLFIGGGILCAFCIVALFSAFYTVKETESAVITTFGSATVAEGKGIHTKIPFIQHVKKVDTTVKTCTIGYHTEDGKVVRNSRDMHDSIMITSDFNFIDADFDITYQVVDPVKYLYVTDSPEEIVRNISISSIRTVFSGYTVDEALTTGKGQIEADVKERIRKELEDEDIGIALSDAVIQDVDPPTKRVTEAFTAVETAKQGKESAINKANAYKNKKLPEAEAEADKILQEAEAKKSARINEAKGQVARFEKEYAEFKKYPLITKQRMFFETMNDVLPRLELIINDDTSGNVLKIKDLDKASIAEHVPLTKDK